MHIFQKNLISLPQMAQKMWIWHTVICEIGLTEILKLVLSQILWFHGALSEMKMHYMTKKKKIKTFR